MEGDGGHGDGRSKTGRCSRGIIAGLTGKHDCTHIDQNQLIVINVTFAIAYLEELHNPFLLEVSNPPPLPVRAQTLGKKKVRL